MKRTCWKSLRAFLSLGLTAVMLLSALSVIPLSVGAASPSFVNLFDSSSATQGFYRKNTSTGKADHVSSTSHYTSDIISVTAGDVITFGPAKMNQDFHMMGFDNDGKVVENQIPLNSATKLSIVDTFNTYNGNPYAIYSYKVPAGVTRVHVTNYKDVNAIFTVTKNQSFDCEDFVAYWNASTSRAQTFAPFSNIIPATAGGKNETGSPLWGRSALFVGDSITYGAFDGAANKSWAGRIGVKHQMQYVNAGVSGTSISNVRAGTHGRILTQLENHKDEDFQYVIMHGGVNDAWDKISVGQVTEGFEYNKFRGATFAGGLEQTFYLAKENFPDATLGFIMNFALPKCHYGNISNMGPYMAVAKEVCEKWGVHYLDLYNDTEFCYNVLKVDTLTYFGDTYYCHPNAAGHDLIAPKVEAWMESLPVKGESLFNLFDVAGATPGHYHPETNAAMTSTFCTNTAKVKAGDVITFGPVPKTGQDFYLIGYNAAGAIVSTDFRNRSVLTVVDSSFRNHVIYSYTVPEGVTTLRFTVPNDLKAIYTATKNNPFDAFSFHNYWNENEKRAATFLKTTRSDSRLDGYSGQPFKVNEDSILKGRSVLFLGDSIVSSERDTSLFYRGWADRIGKVNAMSYVNNGKSGTSFSTQKSDRIISYLNVIGRKSFDYVITNGGVNDAWVSAPVGKITDSFDVKDFNTATFAGALEEFFYTVKQKYPTAIVGYICTFSMPSASYGSVSNMTAYYAAAKQICEKWGVHCLDLYNNTEFCRDVLQTHTTTYMADHVHPNGAGNDLIYPLIEEWMKSLPHPDNDKEEPTPENPTPENPTPENPTPDVPADENDKTGEETPAPETTAAANSGCGGSLTGIGVLAATTAAAVALTAKKKKKKE